MYAVLSHLVMCGLEFERTVDMILHKILLFLFKYCETLFGFWLPHAVSAEDLKAELLPVIANAVHQLK